MALALCNLHLPHQMSRPPPRSRLTQYLGLGAGVRPLNVVALSSSALLSISFLVFLNGILPFFLTTVLNVPRTTLGRVTGNLLLADELLALVLVFVWGSVADRITVRWVAVAGHLFVALGFAFITVSRNVYPEVLVSRLVFTIGASALVTTLGAALAGMTSITHDEEPTSEPTEASSLLPATPTGTANPANVARFAGLLGFSSGIGALLAVFGLLRLPPILAPHLDESLKRAILATFYIVILLALGEGIFLVWGLKGPVVVAESGEAELEERVALGWKDSAVGIAKELSRGFVIASGEGEVALACLSGFVTRAQAIVVSAFIPLLINDFFLRSDLCESSSPTSQTCRPAIILTAILTGTIQLISLILAPAFGSLSARLSPSLILSLASLLGATSFLGLAGTEDPRSGIVWLWVGGMGISQSAGLVISLALVARGRSKVMAKGGGAAKEVGGAISGAYSACGGLGILIVGKAGGSLFDQWVGAPFLLVGILAGAVSAFAAGLHWRSRGS
ncbi:hypothetical protein RQP46_005703 [Phenoliferia psychrophenolica]